MKTNIGTNNGFTLIELLVVMTIIAVLAAVGFGAFTRAQETARISQATSNLKGNIYNAMFQYAAENNDSYPSKIRDNQGNVTDASNANQAFRELFKQQYLSDEAVFQVSPSPASPDGDIGDAASEFNKALENNECHYALVKGKSTSSPGSFPLVWENSKTGGWDPSWDPQEAGNPVKGRTWSNARVLVLLQGGGVKTFTLADKKSTSKLETIGTGSRNQFTKDSSGNTEALDPQLN